MKRLLMLTAIIVSAGCGPLIGGGSCPDIEDLPRQPVLSGEYSEPFVSEYGDISPLEEATDIQLTVDRDAGTATLAFTNAAGQQVEIDYLATSAMWDF